MRTPDANLDITNLPDLERLFEAPKEPSILKELDHVDANYAAWIAAAPFCALASAGPGGLDCSPRGDAPGFVRVLDHKTLLLPERRGNNRLDSLRNVLHDPRVALLFMVPGVAETLRVNGRARINTDPELCAELAVDGKAPKVVLVVSVDAVYFQCSRALLRSQLWDPSRHVARSTLPSPGKILHDVTQGKIDGDTYERELIPRIKSTLY
jgi:PPOX class probable FMN-dependent enzyme